MLHGFFSDYPYSRDIAVSPEMESTLGQKNVVARLSNTRYNENRDIIADVIVDGKTYIAQSKRLFDMDYWLIVA